MSQRSLTSTIIPIPTGLSRGRALEKRIAAPVCTPRALASRRGLARNDKVRRGRRPAVSAAEQMPLGYDVPHKTCRGERPCPPHATAAPCRAGPACPAGSNAYFAAGHMGPALRDLRLTHPPPSAKRTQIVNKCPLAVLSHPKEFPFHSSKCATSRYVNRNKCVVSFINRVYRRFFHIARRNSKGS